MAPDNRLPVEIDRTSEWRLSESWDPQPFLSMDDYRRMARNSDEKLVEAFRQSFEDKLPSRQQLNELRVKCDNAQEALAYSKSLVKSTVGENKRLRDRIVGVGEDSKVLIQAAMDLVVYFNRVAATTSVDPACSALLSSVREAVSVLETSGITVEIDKASALQGMFEILEDTA